MNKKEIKLISKLVLSDNYIVNYNGETVVSVDEEAVFIDFEGIVLPRYWDQLFWDNFTFFKKIKLTSPK